MVDISLPPADELPTYPTTIDYPLRLLASDRLRPPQAIALPNCNLCPLPLTGKQSSWQIFIYPLQSLLPSPWHAFDHRLPGQKPLTITRRRLLYGIISLAKQTCVFPANFVPVPSAGKQPYLRVGRLTLLPTSVVSLDNRHRCRRTLLQMIKQLIVGLAVLWGKILSEETKDIFLNAYFMYFYHSPTDCLLNRALRE